MNFLRTHRLALALAAIVFAGFAFRAWCVAQEQHFQGDQGRDYLVVMEWLQDGRWPLLGPMRIAGDFTLGPGWFYTIAPPLAASGFSLRAGALWMAVFSAAAIALAALWVRRGSRSPAAALALAALWSFGANWDLLPKLWNPSVLPFATAALAFLLQPHGALTARRLAAIAILLAILPQWHTTGILVALAALPGVAWTLWRRGAELRTERHAARRSWGAIAAVALLLLYVPPAIEAIRNDGGNLAGYLSRTASNVEAPANRMEVRDAPRLLAMPAMLAAKDLYDGARPFAGAEYGALAIALLVAMPLAAFLGWRRHDPSIAFLLLLLFGYGLLGVWRGPLRDPYFYTCTLPAAPMLLAFVAGAALRNEHPNPTLRNAARVGAAAILAWCVLLAARKSPMLIELAQGRVWYAGALERSETIAARIRKEVEADGNAPFSLHLAEPGNFSAHLRVILRRKGLRPANGDYYTWDIRREEVGEALYLVTQNATAPLPIRCAGTVELLRDWDRAKLYRVRAETLPEDFERLEIRAEETAVVVTAR